MTNDQLRQRAALEAAVHAASDDLHQTTGRTDQSPQQIEALHPDHPATVAWQKTEDELDAFDRRGRDK